MKPKPQVRSNALGRIKRVDLADGQAEIAGDLIVLDDDEGLG